MTTFSAINHQNQSKTPDFGITALVAQDNYEFMRLRGASIKLAPHEFNRLDALRR